MAPTMAATELSFLFTAFTNSRSRPCYGCEKSLVNESRNIVQFWEGSACQGTLHGITLCDISGKNFKCVRPRPCKNDETFCSGSTYSESFYTQCYQPTISDHLLVHISRVISKDRFIKNCSSHLDGGYLGMYVSVTSCNLNIIKKNY